MRRGAGREAHRAWRASRAGSASRWQLLGEAELAVVARGWGATCGGDGRIPRMNPWFELAVASSGDDRAHTVERARALILPSEPRHDWEAPTDHP